MVSHNIVICGFPGILASNVVTSYIEESGVGIFCLLSPVAFENFLALCQIARIDSSNYIQRIEPNEIPLAASVWFFADISTDGCEFNRLTPSFLKFDVQVINYVITPYGGGNYWRWPNVYSEVLPKPIAPCFKEFSIVRIFKTSLITASITNVDGWREGFLHFLATLFDLKTEIEQRFTDYFEHCALRLYAPADATINLVRAEQAAKLMLAITNCAKGGNYIIASPESPSLADVLEHIGEVYEISLLAEEDREELNAIDLLFDLRLMNFQKHFGSPDPKKIEEICNLAEFAPHNLVLNEEAQIDLFDSIHCTEHENNQTFTVRIDEFPGILVKNELHRDGHDKLLYYSLGSGENTLVFINAIGQGLDYWYRMLDYLHPCYRILIWVPRELDLPTEGIGMGCHIDDLEAIVNQEKVRKCHLVAWCTGPKISVEYYLRCPSIVQSMVFLNPTIKCSDNLTDLDTAYERNFEQLFHILEQRPSMAPAVTKSLQSSTNELDDIDLSNNIIDSDIGTLVLARMNEGLRSHVLRPFISPESVVNYAHQMLDFWRYDLCKKAQDIGVPVLFISSEYDKVASPKAANLAAALFPKGRLLHIPGATHYFFYDRPDVISHQLDAFFENPDSIGELVPHPND